MNSLYLISTRYGYGTVGACDLLTLVLLQNPIQRPDGSYIARAIDENGDVYAVEWASDPTCDDTEALEDYTSISYVKTAYKAYKSMPHV